MFGIPRFFGLLGLCACLPRSPKKRNKNSWSSGKRDIPAYADAILSSVTDPNFGSSVQSPDNVVFGNFKVDDIVPLYEGASAEMTNKENVSSQLYVIAELMKADPTYKLTLKGNTAGRGNVSDLNARTRRTDLPEGSSTLKQLMIDRATSVSNLLINMGVPAGRITATSGTHTNIPDAPSSGGSIPQRNVSVELTH